MNPEELQKNIALYYSKLPKESQEVFAKMEWLEKIKQISGKYALSQNQQETLGTETTLVLLGIIHPEEYEATLKAEIAIAPELLREILDEIRGSIIDRIRPQLTDTFEKNSTGEEEEVIEGTLDDRFKKLPPYVQDAIGESNYQNALYEISRRYKFTVEQMGILEELLVNMMLGLISEGDFRKNVKSALRLTEGEMQDLINLINAKILVGVKNKIMAPNAPEQGIKKEEMEILHDAGIKIIDGNAKESKPDMSLPELPAGKTVAPSPMTQKFSGAFQTPTIKTSHQSVPQPKTETEKKLYPKGADPYREIPE